MNRFIRLVKIKSVIYSSFEFCDKYIYIALMSYLLTNQKNITHLNKY